MYSYALKWPGLNQPDPDSGLNQPDPDSAHDPDSAQISQI